MIHKLEMRDFGMFHEETVYFDEGFQLLAGDNESGKSTMVMCIRTLLYGFSKDSLHMRRYSEAYDLYFPKDRNRYAAAMELSVAGKRYCIERNFLKENERLNIISLDDNRVLGDNEELYRYSKIPQPGALFWGLSQDDFMRFFCLEDLRLYSAADIFSRIEEAKNYLTTGSYAVDMAKAYAYLDKEERALGTERAKKSPVGENRENIRSLEADIARKKAEENRLREDIARKEALADRLSSLKREERQLNDKKYFLPQLERAMGEVAVLDRQLAANEKEIDRFESMQKRTAFSDSRLLRYFVIASLAAAAVTLLLFVNEISIWTVGVFLTGAVSLITLGIFGMRQRTKKRIRLYHECYMKRDRLLMEKDAIFQWFDPHVEREFEMELLLDAMTTYAAHLKGLPDRSAEVAQAVENTQRTIGQLEGQLKRENAIAAERRKKEEDYAEELAQKAHLERELEAIEMTRTLLEEAEAGDREAFLADMLEKAGEYLYTLSDGRYGKILMGDGEFSVIDAWGASFYEAQLSRSTAHILVMALRFAALERMDASIPMVLDDVFVYADGRRKTKIYSVLESLERQCICLTTTEAETERGKD